VTSQKATPSPAPGQHIVRGFVLTLVITRDV
jgi:hypothetical protein